MTLDTGPEERGGWINFILVEIRADSVFLALQHAAFVLITLFQFHENMRVYLGKS